MGVGPQTDTSFSGAGGGKGFVQAASKSKLVIDNVFIMFL
jgi:hypothetical protein